MWWGVSEDKAHWKCIFFISCVPVLDDEYNTDNINCELKGQDVVKVNGDGTSDEKDEDAVDDNKEEEEILQKDETEVEEVDEGEVQEEEVDEGEVQEEVKPLTEEEKKELECLNVIKDIRHREFGVGIELSEEVADLMEVYQKRSGRSLERLSTELYSKDTHFVLELVQNADDNSYSEDVGQTGPALKFIVEKNCVTVLNNESGFREKDIRALCDVGKSTKGKHKYGYIGQKGIGFKSVFRITDKPIIHSNGYHICFDAKSGPMGYILPHWIGQDGGDDITDLDDGGTPDNGWKTKIVLPLKTDIQQSKQSRSLANRFHDIHPSLLLFLHRLKSISIENKVSGETHCMQRTDGNHGVIEIQHGDGVDRWLVVKKQLDASKMTKENVESTELAVAFLLQPTSTNSDVGSLYPQSIPAQQKVFAFLPLRSYGFRFVVQGDFDVPSSREDVDMDSAWNQWLRSELPTLFIEALQAFRGHPSLSDLQAVCSFLQYVPLEDEILGFFKPVARQILQQLKASPCLPTDVQTEDDHYEWKLPSELAVTRDPLLRQVITSDLLHQHLNRCYLHPNVLSAISMPLINMLGVQTLSVKHLLEVGKAITSQTDEDTLSVSFVAKWLACLHRLMESDYSIQEDTIIQQVKNIAIIPLSNGQYVALSTCSVFFPVSVDTSEMKTPGRSKKKTQSQLHALEKDLNTVPLELLTCLNEVENSQVHSVLKLIGVCDMKPRQVIQNHIMPVFTTDKWQEKDHKLLMEYVIYIKAESEKLPSVCNMEELKDVVQVITNHGLINPTKQPTHFTTDYGNKIDLQRDLPGLYCDNNLKLIVCDTYHLRIPGGALHRLYLWTHLFSPPSYDRQPQHVSSWQKFFANLGVLHSLAVKKEKVTLQENEMANSPWSRVYQFWPKSEDSMYHIEDFVSEEFHALVTSQNLRDDQKVRQSQILLHLLEEEWETRLSKYTNANVCGKDNNILTSTQSSFAIYITTLPWLPAVHNPNETPVYLAGRDIHLYSDKLVSLLSNHVYYLMLPVSNQALIQHLKMKTLGDINVSVILGHLKDWCTEDGDGDGEVSKKGALFQTTLTHMYTIYTYLQQEGSPSQIQHFFENYPAIFVPENPDPRRLPPHLDTPVNGKFYHKSDVYWSDPSDLFVKYAESAQSSRIQVPQQPQLQPYYQRISGFFLESGLKIEAKPKMTDYIALLLHIVDIITLPNNRLLQDVFKLYAVLGEKCLDMPTINSESHHHLLQDAPKTHHHLLQDSPKISQLYSKHLLSIIEKEKVFPTKSNRWVSLQDGIFIPDDKHLEKLFRDKEVNFLDIGESKVGYHRNRRPGQRDGLC
ncbi:uncharacterized protein LOC144437336 [Glandiceps talaboti]